MHSCLSKKHQENNLSLTRDFPLNSVTPLLRFLVLLIFSILHRKINTQRFLDINLFRSDQFNLPPIREEGVVGEEQCWGLSTGTQKNELHSDTSCSDEFYSFYPLLKEDVTRSLNIAKIPSPVTIMKGYPAVPRAFFRNIAAVQTTKNAGSTNTGTLIPCLA